MCMHRQTLIIIDIEAKVLNVWWSKLWQKSHQKFKLLVSKNFGDFLASCLLSLFMPQDTFKIWRTTSDLPKFSSTKHSCYMVNK